MRLFDSRRAPNPRRIRWLLAEKGVETLEIVNVDLLKGEHRDADFARRAGVANVPALELDDGVVLTESIAIGRYLESVWPEPNLFGRTPEDVAVIEMWTRRVELLVAMPLMLAVRHSHPALAVLEAQSPEVAQTNLAAATRALGLLERRLGHGPYIAGDRFTIADIVAAVGFDFAKMIRFDLPDDRPNLRRWRDEVMARPAARAGL